ncbi:desmin-like [Xiphophorus hellerii]|uniref:desmin-like n=1 Tax=Xiphophorus hellerii TaxID=8084 RepID=UPI0013B46733|nr:desmin-like [Xiphophorus hellerii]
MANNSELVSKLKHILAKRDEEQVQLQELNGRFASYIEKIRSLEQKNQKLGMQVKQLQSHKSTRVTELYEEEINNLRMAVQNQNQYSSRLEFKLEDLKERLQKANDEKEEALKKLDSLKEDLDAPTLASKGLEAEIKSLQDQLAFQKKIHEEKTQEIQELKIQFEEMMNDVQTDAANSDLAAVLRELKSQFQNTANTKSRETEERYKSKISELTETVNTNNETLRKLSQENTNLKNQSQKNLSKISSLTTTIEEMEERSQTLQETITTLKAEKNKMKEDMEESHETEIQTLQEKITTLEDEKNKMKDDMEIQLLEYQDLLKEKGDLDKEIAVYRALLDEEENRTQANPVEENPRDRPKPQTSDPSSQ